ncbi:LPXTG cell wall anchor domain-containing protein, partial [Mycobacterium tuberculosis]|nr:LPXTG cell wall anchor domain-containing protein [Mycobacterium tuberculosis]
VYAVIYRTTVTDGGKAGTYTNSAKFEIEGEETVIKKGEVVRQGGGGTGDGDEGSTPTPTETPTAPAPTPSETPTTPGPGGDLPRTGVETIGTLAAGAALLAAGAVTLMLVRRRKISEES